MSDSRINLILDRLELTFDTLPTRPEVISIINDLEDQITFRGLPAANLTRLINLVCRGLPIGIAANLRIIRDFLIPREIIPTEIALRIISAQAEGSRLPIRVREKLLRWLVVVHKYLEDIKVLSRLYGVLFSYLKYEILRPWVCHLLFISTTSVVVKPWRVQYLIELHRKNRESPHLCGLIMLYKEYAPQLIVDRFPIVGASVFRHPDPDLADRVSRALELNSRQELQGHDLMSGINHFKMSKTKRQKLEIPVVQTDLTKMRAGIEDISSLQEFVHNVHKLEFPLQMASVLNDNGFALRLLIYKDEDSVWVRLNNWLSSMLFEEMHNPEGLCFLLGQVEKFARYTKILPIATEEFLLAYLSQWDGSDIDGYPLRKLIFMLLPYLPMMDKTLFSAQLLEPLGRIMINGADSQWGTDLIYSFSLMIKTWNITYGPLLGEMAQTPVGPDTSILGGLTLPDIEDTFQLLAAFVNEFGIDILEQTQDDVHVQHTLLFFYETFLTTKFAEILPSAAIFSNQLAQRLLFGYHLVMFSRVCNLIVSYDPHFSAAITKASGLDHFTSLKNDVFELLWTNSAFLLGSEPALDCDKDFVELLSDFSDMHNHRLSDLFSITHSSLFILTNIRVLNRRLAKDYALAKTLTCPITENSVRSLDITYDTFKLDVLRDLEKQGYTGLSKFVKGMLGIPISEGPSGMGTSIFLSDASVGSAEDPPQNILNSTIEEPEQIESSENRSRSIEFINENDTPASVDSNSSVPGPPASFEDLNEPLAPDLSASSDDDSEDTDNDTTGNLDDFLS